MLAFSSIARRNDGCHLLVVQAREILEAASQREECRSHLLDVHIGQGSVRHKAQHKCSIMDEQFIVFVDSEKPNNGSNVALSDERDRVRAWCITGIPILSETSRSLIVLKGMLHTYTVAFANMKAPSVSVPSFPSRLLIFRESVAWVSAMMPGKANTL